MQFTLSLPPEWCIFYYHLISFLILWLIIILFRSTFKSSISLVSLRSSQHYI